MYCNQSIKYTASEIKKFCRICQNQFFFVFKSSRQTEGDPYPIVWDSLEENAVSNTACASLCVAGLMLR
jgi:hypothetical protein